MFSFNAISNLMGKNDCTGNFLLFSNSLDFLLLVFMYKTKTIKYMVRHARQTVVLDEVKGRLSHAFDGQSWLKFYT